MADKDVESIQLTGAQRQKALDRFNRQIESWGLKLPSVEPLVLDFGLGDFEHTGLIESWVVNEVCSDGDAAGEGALVCGDRQRPAAGDLDAVRGGGQPFRESEDQCLAEGKAFVADGRAAASPERNRRVGGCNKITHRFGIIQRAGAGTRPYSHGRLRSYATARHSGVEDQEIDVHGL